MNGQFPPAGPAPAPQSFGSQIPAEHQGRIDPNSPIQSILFDRIGSLGPEDLAALDRIPDQAAAVLKRLLPEIDFVIDQITKDDQMGGGVPTQNAPPMPTQNSGQMPASRLGQIG